jgi:hypothetical protein
MNVFLRPNDTEHLFELSQRALMIMDSHGLEKFWNSEKISRTLERS